MKFRARKSTDFLYVVLKNAEGKTLYELHKEARRAGKLTVDFHYLLQDSGLVEEGRQYHEIAGNVLENSEKSIYVLIDVGENGLLSDAQRIALGELTEKLYSEFPYMKQILVEE